METDHRRTGAIRVSALVTVYKAERFLRACLEDLVTQSLGDELEILVLDSGSPEQEGEIVREFESRHPNLRYFRTEQREPTSEAFNRLTSVARGTYLTNANADDAHHPRALELMARALDEHPEFGIVYPDSAITYEANESFLTTTASTKFSWPDYTHPAALSCCLFGPHPMWRRDAHALCGAWNPAHKIANDQDLFLRIAFRYGAVHLAETLGLFLKRPDSNSGADRKEATLRDVHTVMHHYRRSTPLRTIFPALEQYAGDPMAHAACLTEMGNLCLLGPYNDPGLALEFYARAGSEPWTGGPPAELRAGVANNAANAFAQLGLADRALKSLELARDLPNAAESARLLATGSAPSATSLWQLAHGVLLDSRRSSALIARPDGELEWSPQREQLPWDVFEGPDGVPWSRHEAFDLRTATLSELKV